MPYAFRCFARNWPAPTVPRSYWLAPATRDGFGVTSNPHEAATFNLDDSEKLLPTLNTAKACGVDSPFRILWQWEKVPADELSAAVTAYDQPEPAHA